jgi:sulfur carrier protein
LRSRSAVPCNGERWGDGSRCPAIGRRYNHGMEILLNGEAREVVEATTIATLLEAAGLVERRVAVEVNHEIVPRSLHGERRLAAGDRVEIVHAIGGG